MRLWTDFPGHFWTAGKIPQRDLGMWPCPGRVEWIEDNSEAKTREAGYTEDITLASVQKPNASGFIFDLLEGLVLKTSWIFNTGQCSELCHGRVEISEKCGHCLIGTFDMGPPAAKRGFPKGVPELVTEFPNSEAPLPATLFHFGPLTHSLRPRARD